MGVRNLLVTTDFSEAAREAYPVAVALAREFEAGLHLVHVAEPLAPFSYLQGLGLEADIPDDPYHEGLDRQIKSEAGHEALKDAQPMVRLLSHRHPYVALNRYIRENSIDLIVLSTHGHTGIGYLLLGSFALNSVRHSSAPVLIYRKSADGEAYRPRRVVVPFDFSDRARAVFPWVRTLSETFKAQFAFLHVLEPPPPFIEAIDDFGERFEHALGEAPSDVKARFQSIREQDLSGISSEFVVRTGAAYREIIEYAGEWKADLVLLSTHGHSGLTDMLLGSVAEKVVRKATCPVMTVRSRIEDD